MRTRLISLAAGLLMLSAQAQTSPTAAQQKELLLKKSPNSLRLREEVANAYALEKKPDKVIELLNPYTDQLDAGGFLLLASSYSSKKDFINEVRVLKILVDQNDENYKSHMVLGQAYLKLAQENPNAERYSEFVTSGVQQLRRVLQINKKYKPGFDLLLRTLLDQKDNNEARELLMEGLDKFGERPELYHELCRIDSIDGFVAQAIKNCRESIRVSPTFPDHYVFLVQSLTDQGEDQQAERAIVSAAKRFPKSEFVQWAAGVVYFRKKNYHVAARYYRAAVAADPNKARSHFGLAQSLFETDGEKEAFEHYKLACKGDASTRDAFLAAGGRLKLKKNMDLGSKYIQAASDCR